MFFYLHSSCEVDMMLKESCPKELQIAINIKNWFLRINKEQGRIHGYPSRVRVGRGYIWGHFIIWAGTVRPKTAKTSDAGSQYRCGRVGRGIQPPSTPKPTPNTQTYAKSIKSASFPTFQLDDHGPTDQRTNGPTDQRTNGPTDGQSLKVVSLLSRNSGCQEINEFYLLHVTSDTCYFDY